MGQLQRSTALRESEKREAARRLDEVVGENKRDRGALISAALAALHSLRLHLTQTLSGLRAQLVLRAPLTNPHISGPFSPSPIHHSPSLVHHSPSPIHPSPSLVHHSPSLGTLTIPGP